MRPELPPEWTEQDIREWLLTYATSGQSSIPLPSDMAAAVAVKKMFLAAAPEGRERLKRAVIGAVQEWMHAAHGYPALQQLCQIAAVLRASAVIPRLAEIIRRECAYRRPDPRRHAGLATATATLTGFAPAVDLTTWLEILFYDPDIDPVYGGLLFVGLCKTRPDTISLHTARFLTLREQVDDRFASIGAALLDAVPPVTLIAQFRMLSPEARDVIAQLLQPVRNSELVFKLDVKGIELSWIHQPTVTVPVSSSPDLLAAAYAEAMKSFVPANPSTSLLRYIQD